jgi:hypothetical protein
VRVYYAPPCALILHTCSITVIIVYTESTSRHVVLLVALYIPCLLVTLYIPCLLVDSVYNHFHALCNTVYYKGIASLLLSVMADAYSS